MVKDVIYVWSDNGRPYLGMESRGGVESLKCVPLSFMCLLLHRKHTGDFGRRIMQDDVGVHSLPCFVMCYTAVHNTLIGYGLVALCIGIMYPQCISNRKLCRGREGRGRVSRMWSL